MSCNANDDSPLSVCDTSWISWFVGLHGNEFLCRVPNEYMKDKFNLTGLETFVLNFNRSFNIIMESRFNPQVWNHICEVEAENAAKLYGLIHARYILTLRGINDMCMKYERGDFGMCPRVYCSTTTTGQRVLPIGQHDDFGRSNVKVYCPRCHDIYQPRSRCALLDGAMFGTSFPHMFLMQLPELRPEVPKEKYTARLYGFKLHKLALMPLTESPDKNISNEKSPCKRSNIAAAAAATTTTTTTTTTTPNSSMRRTSGRRLNL